MNPTETINEHLRIIRTQRNVAGRVQKLKDADSELMRKVMLYAYNPYIRFGIKISPSVKSSMYSVATAGGIGIEDDDVWNLLDSFSKSTASSSAKSYTLLDLCRRMDPFAVEILCGILEKSVVTGISASTVNKAYEDLIPVFNVQLAAKYSEKKMKVWPVYAEIKHDGLRAIGIIHPTNEVEVVTRKGNPIPAAVPFHKNLVKIGKAYKKVFADRHGLPYSGCITDGEVCGESFNDAVSTFRSHDAAQSGTYQVFDILPMEALTDKAFVSLPFSSRRTILEEVFAEVTPDPAFTDIIRSKSYIVSSKTEIMDMYHQARLNGHEGLIIKLPDGGWTTKRTSDWQKIKACETEDLKVIGAFEGTGDKTGTLGGLIVDRDGVQVRVGSGFTDDMSNIMWAKFLRDLERSARGVTDEEEFELIGGLIEVSFQEVTPDGSLRHPVFVKFRHDKNEVSF